MSGNTARLERQVAQSFPESTMTVTTSDSTIGACLALELMDQQTIAASRDSKAFIRASFPGVLDVLFDPIGKFSETAPFFESRHP